MDGNSRKVAQRDGNPSRVDHHFRGDKMALWLDLIPRIHRPEGAEFEPNHHQLDDHENLTSFEDDGLTKLDIKPLELDRITQPTVEISSKTRSTRINSKTPNSQSTEVKVRRTSSKPAGQHPVTEPTVHVVSSVARDQPKEVDSKADKISQEASGSISSVALTITVAFALVGLNLLVFAAACCQLRRLRKTKELSAAGKGDVDADASETEYLRGREKGEQDMEIEPPSRNNSNYYTNTNSRHPSNSKSSSGRHRSNSDCHSCNCNSTPQPPRKPSPHQSNSHNQHSQPPPPPPLQHRYALIIDGAETYLRHSDGEDDIDVMNGCVVEPRSSSPTQSDQDSSTLV